MIEEISNPGQLEMQEIGTMPVIRAEIMTTEGMMQYLGTIEHRNAAWNICPFAYEGCNGAKNRGLFAEYCLGNYHECPNKTEEGLK